MAELIVAALCLVAIACCIHVVRSGLRWRRLQRALAGGERTPEVEALLAEQRRRWEARARQLPPGELSKSLRKLSEEAEALIRQGRFDAAVRERYDRQFTAVLEQEERTARQEIARVESGPRMTRRKWAAYWAVMMLFAGTILHFQLTEHFIAAHGDVLAVVSAALTVCGLPIIAMGMLRILRSQRTIERYGARRWLVILGGLLFAGVVLATAPRGYVAAAGWLIGVPAAEEGEVLELSESGFGKGCHGGAKLHTDRGSAQICTTGKLADGPLEPGQAVVIEGRGSRLGIFVERVRSKPKRRELER